MAITDWPLDERPREKLLSRGATALSDAELLAIFLRTGVAGLTAVDLARDLLNRFGGLRQLLDADQHDFCAAKGLGSAKFAQLQAVLEMARRHLHQRLQRGDALTSPALTRQYLQAQLRRMLVSAWNVAELPKMALMPCHAFFQFYVAGGRLSCQMYQRSADLFLGVPFNIASYAALTMMAAQVAGLRAGEFVLTLGDAHLYLNHLEQARQQVGREPKAFPRLRLNPAVKDIFGFAYEDFTLEGYEPHPAIKAPIAV